MSRITGDFDKGFAITEAYVVNHTLLEYALKQREDGVGADTIFRPLKKYKALIDTGAMVSCVSPEVAKLLVWI